MSQQPKLEFENWTGLIHQLYPDWPIELCLIVKLYINMQQESTNYTWQISIKKTFQIWLILRSDIEYLQIFTHFFYGYASCYKLKSIFLTLRVISENKNKLWWLYYEISST